MNSQVFYKEVPSFQVSKITIDSREVVENAIFVAIKGAKVDGHNHINQAIKQGAKLIVATKQIDVPSNISLIIVENSLIELARLSSLFYNTLENGANYIGITGTDGKTTTALITKQLIDNSGYIGTNGIEFKQTFIKPKLTTPIAPDLHSYFAQMTKEGIKNIIMEVSSHARVLHRDAVINYQVAAFTNLTHDHLDFHQTMEAYFAAKASLFTTLNEKSTAVININDDYGQKLTKMTKAQVISYGINNSQAVLNATNLETTSNGTTFKLNYLGKLYQINSPLIGEFNVANLLCAIGISLGLKKPIEQIIAAIECLEGIPGRLEVIKQKQDFLVIVDFAHTPNAIQKILELANQLKKSKKVITVTGAAGQRDKLKRPIIGKILISQSDYTIITTDDPYNEDPQAIALEMIENVQKAPNYQIILDRREAINTAFEKAQKGDIVLVLGRGHETKLPINNQEIEFDDRVVCKELLKVREGENE